MSELTREDRQILIDHWLPRLDKMVRRRAPIRWIMAGLICLPAIMVATMLYLVIAGKTTPAIMIGGSSLLIIFSGLGAWAFKWLGKMQACDDIVEVVAGCVFIGSCRHIIDSMNHLHCLGKLGGLLKDVKPILDRMNDEERTK